MSGTRQSTRRPAAAGPRGSRRPAGGPRPPRSGVAPRSSANLGSILRSVLVAPSAGFAGAIAAADRRERTGERRPEGIAPYVLAAAGGAATMLLWLRLGGLIGLRRVDPSQFRWDVLGGAVALGIILSLGTQILVSLLGPAAARSLGGGARGRDLRIVWGASAFPQVLGLALLPLDLVIVGPESFTTARLSDSMATGWAAVSISIGAGLAAWSLVLFVRGLQVTTTTQGFRSALLVVGSLVCAALVAGTAVGLLVLVSGLAA